MPGANHEAGAHSTPDKTVISNGNQKTRVLGLWALLFSMAGIFPPWVTGSSLNPYFLGYRLLFSGHGYGYGRLDVARLGVEWTIITAVMMALYFSAPVTAK